MQNFLPCKCVDIKIWYNQCVSRGKYKILGGANFWVPLVSCTIFLSRHLLSRFLYLPPFVPQICLQCTYVQRDLARKLHGLSISSFANAWPVCKVMCCTDSIFDWEKGRIFPYACIGTLFLDGVAFSTLSKVQEKARYATECFLHLKMVVSIF